MSRKIKFHAFHFLFRLFAYLADISGGWRVFVSPKLVLGSLIVGLGLTGCGTKTKSKMESKFGFKPTDSIKVVDVNQDTTLLYANKPPELNTTLCYFQAPIIKIENKDTVKSQPVFCELNNESESPEINSSPKDSVNFIFDVVEQMPKFPGGEENLFKFISKHLIYPAIAQENGIQGKVMCRFIITKNGKVQNPQILRSLDPTCDIEAIRVLKTLPIFIPGKQNGVNVNVWYTIPITFKLPK